MSLKTRIKNSIKVLTGKSDVILVNKDVTITLTLTAKEIAAFKREIEFRSLGSGMSDDILQRVLLQCSGSYYEADYEIFKTSINKPEMLEVSIKQDGKVVVENI